MRFRRRQETPAPSDALGPYLYGDAPADQWPPPSASTEAEPWKSFAIARAHAQAGRVDDAVLIWRSIAGNQDFEPRHALQAWHFLRASGAHPTDDAASTVLGLSAEVAVRGGHDHLVAYRDGSVRYLNHAGPVIVTEGEPSSSVSQAVAAWIAIGDTLAQVIGVWDGNDLPPLPTGHTRILLLTPGGKRFGQGPDGLLRQDRPALAFLDAATRVLHEATTAVG